MTGRHDKDYAETFASITDAWQWYESNGGQRKKASFFDIVPRIGTRKVSRYHVSEMLRKEGETVAPVENEFLRRKEKAEVKKAEADAERSHMQAEQMRRELDASWIERDKADEITCVWVSRLRDATSYHLGRALLALIHAAGGNPARLAEVQAIVDEALATACNEIAASEEITVEIEGDDE